MASLSSLPGQLLIALQNMLALLAANIWFVLILLGILWSVHLVNAALHYRLNRWGIYPRRFWGLRGVVLSPFLHGNSAHLFFNSVPLFVLISFTLIYGRQHFYWVTGSIIILSGLATWLFGRRAIHIGASSLAMGYWGYLLVIAIRYPSAISIVLGLVCLYYLGGLVVNLFSVEKKSSWEGHLFGFIAGLVTSCLM